MNKSASSKVPDIGGYRLRYWVRKDFVRKKKISKAGL